MASYKDAVERVSRLRGFLDVDPRNLALLRDLAATAMQTADHANVVYAVDRLAELDEAEAGDLALRVGALRALGAAGDAIAAAHAALDRYPGNPWIKNELARALFSARQFADALAALPEQADDPILRASVAETRVRLLHHLEGHLEEAAETGLRHLQQFPEDTTVTRALCPVLTDLSRFEEALKLAQGLMSQQDQVYEINEVFAADALQKDELKSSRQWLDAALAQRQDDGRIWLLKGMLSLRENKSADAIAELKQAIALMPSHAGSHLALGWAHLFRGERQEASKAFTAGAAASATFAEVYGSLAVVAVLEGDRATAQTEIKKALRLDANCASAQYAQALLSGADAQTIDTLGRAVIAFARRRSGIRS